MDENKSNKILKEQEESKTTSKGWRYSHLIIALIVGFITQALFLPCLCHIGQAKVNFALCFDGLIIIRMIGAMALKEKNKGWLFYTAICYSSSIWIHCLFEILRGH